MKTALQEMIQWTLENAFYIKGQDGVKYVAIDHEEMRKHFDNWLEIEKKQIVLAHKQGRSDKYNDFSRDGEMYYSEIFNEEVS